MNRGTKSGLITINLETLQCARRDSAGPTDRRRRSRRRRKRRKIRRIRRIRIRTRNSSRRRRRKIRK
jgi:hypothetical protein